MNIISAIGIMIAQPNATESTNAKESTAEGLELDEVNCTTTTLTTRVNKLIMHYMGQIAISINNIIAQEKSSLDGNHFPNARLPANRVPRILSLVLESNTTTHRENVVGLYYMESMLIELRQRCAGASILPPATIATAAHSLHSPQSVQSQAGYVKTNIITNTPSTAGQYNPNNLVRM